MTVVGRIGFASARPRNPVLPHELSGKANAPLVIVLGGISSNRHVTSTPANPAPGWWQDQVGSHRAIDTASSRVLGVDFQDGGRRTDGRPARVVTTHDQADALAAALDAIGVERARAIVGASYGGMVALAFAERYATRVEQLVIFGAAHESQPMTTGLRSLQRRIVELGLDHGFPREGLEIARGIAMTTYRTAREFAERFDNLPSFVGHSGVSFEVERYLANRGAAFAARFTPEYFLALSLSSDLHRVNPADVRVPTTLVVAEGDTLVPEEQMTTLARELGAPNQVVRLPTIFGHDAFLKEPVKVAEILATALSNRVPQ